MIGTMTFAGLDVHARSVSAVGVQPASGECWSARLPAESERVAAWLSTLPGPVRVVYEAGPTGFGLVRFLRAVGFDAHVCAPAKTPRPAGRQVKTDGRDATLLARQLLAGQLTLVRVPSEHEEAAREVTRHRWEVARRIRQTKQRIGACLLYHGYVWSATAWTRAHRAWVGSRSFADPHTGWVIDELLAELDHQERGMMVLDRRVADIARDPAFALATARLACFRGVDVLSAATLHLEILDWHRFPRPGSVANFVGLTTSVDQSGQTTTTGGITKAGSEYARRVLIGAAKHAPRRPGAGAHLTHRRRDQPPEVVALARRSQRRLYHRYHHLTARGKTSNEATTACARELAHHLWLAVTMT